MQSNKYKKGIKRCVGAYQKLQVVIEAMGMEEDISKLSLLKIPVLNLRKFLSVDIFS